MERVAIVGSRDYPNLDLVRQYVRGLLADTIVVTGGAPGVDRAAEREAKRCHLTVVVLHADWNKYGRGAGIIRNGEIVDSCDRIVAFWDGVSRGTMNTIQRAEKAGKPVEVIHSKKNKGPEVYIIRQPKIQ